jgi:peroxiredoxin
MFNSPILSELPIDSIPLDANGEFTRQLGMLENKDAAGLGMRSHRYSMYVENGVIKKMFIEPGIMP